MKPTLFGITLGDPSGIGPEIALMASRSLGDSCRLALYGEERVIRKAASITGDTRPLHAMSGPEDYRPGAVNYVQIPSLPGDYELGKVQAACGKAAYDYLERAIHDAMAGGIDAIVTCPLNKESLNLAGLHYAGHTEILGTLTGAKNYAMALDGKGLRVIHVSTHCSLRQACDRAVTSRILDIIRLGHETAAALARTGSPRLAVAGLNPHNGEGGLFGDEEQREIIPAIEAAKAEGFNVTGPVSPDTVFVRALKGEFDMVVAMYHDQGHIPLKLVDFMGGVNITVGLPIIRTSVDHGTAFDLAGTGKADPSSLLAAIDAASRLASAKRTHVSAPRYILVADDLTGANDTGVQLLNHHLAATVGIAEQEEHVRIDPSASALVLDTESRNISAPEASVRIKDVSAALAPFAGSSVFYKKVDSTMRGNLAAEVKTLAESLHLRTIIFTPAFPQNGRVVRDGVLYVDGAPVAETAFARDPIKPVTSSRLADVMAALAPMPLVAAGPATPPEAFTTPGCFCCDAASYEDLLTLVRNVLGVRAAHEVLWVGSAGLAGALLEANGEKREPLPAPHRTPVNAPALLLVGSVHPKNRIQARVLIDSGEAEPLYLDMTALEANPASELIRLESEALKRLKNGANLLLLTSYSEADIRHDTSLAIAYTVGNLVRNLLAAVTVRGLFMTGGETAVHVLRALDCHSARLIREVELGVPLIQLQGGTCPDLYAITKAGAFGNDQTLRNCLAAL